MGARAAPTRAHAKYSTMGSMRFRVSVATMSRNPMPAARSAASFSAAELTYLEAVAQVLAEDCTTLEAWWRR